MEQLESPKTITVSGRRFTGKQIEQVRNTVQTFSNLSRKELAFTLCEHLNWVTPKGGLKINSCLSALDKFERLGLISLPPKKSCTRGPEKPIALTSATSDLAPLDEPLASLLPIELRRVSTKSDKSLWREYVARYHYLGYKRPFGAYLSYFVVSKGRDNQLLGCLLFSASAWAVAPRDLWIGWQRRDRIKRLNYIVNNSRFLIFPWVKVENLASHVLGLITKIIANDWQEVYGYKPVLIETFVDTTRYEGTCYQAANWEFLGTTKGGGRMDRLKRCVSAVKLIYTYPLASNFRDLLRGKVTVKHSEIKPTTLDPKASSHPLWTRIVDILTEVTGAFDNRWQQRRRIIDTLMLVVVIFRLVLSKNSQSYSTTLADIWRNRRNLNLILPQPNPIAPSALTEARKKLDESIFKTMNCKLIDLYEAENYDFSWQGHRLFAVDSTKVNLPRSLSKLGYGTPSSGNYPQGLVSALYQLKSKLPYDFDLVKHANERTCAISHLGLLTANDVVVYDRGYLSYSMLYRHRQRGVFAIFRLPESSFTEIRDFMRGNETDKLVTIELRSKTHTRATKEELGIKKFEPLPLRLIKYRYKDSTFYLGTTLFDQTKYPAELFSEIYHARWGIEELYKISKVLINIEDFHSRTERGVRQEIFAHFALITLTRLLANQVESNLNGFPLLNSSQKKPSDAPLPFDVPIKVNFKNCLAVVSRHLEEMIYSATGCLTAILDRMVISIRRAKQKFRSGRSYARISLKPVGKWRQPTNNRLALALSTTKNE
jgi:hypothetical protein